MHLTFHIYAQLKENPLSTSERVRNAFILRTRNVEVPLQLRQNAFYAASFTQDTPSVSKSTVLDMMMNKSTTAGWDVVFSTSVKQVTDNLYDQFTDKSQ